MIKHYRLYMIDVNTGIYTFIGKFIFKARAKRRMKQLSKTHNRKTKYKIERAY